MTEQKTDAAHRNTVEQLVGPDGKPERPMCGFRRPGVICGEILVGGIYCSRDWGKCDHQFARPNNMLSVSGERKETNA